MRAMSPDGNIHDYEVGDAGVVRGIGAISRSLDIQFDNGKYIKGCSVHKFTLVAHEYSPLEPAMINWSDERIRKTII